MKVIQIFLKNSLRNFNYILYSEITNEAIIFDPTDISLSMPLCTEKNLIPKYLINTHQHHDHIADNEAFLNIAGTKKLILKDYEEFYLSENEKIICRYTPGHVMDHYCYFLYEGSKMVGVICGDTVFNGGVGNCKNGGDPTTLYQTIKNIFVPLNDNVIIYPSHDYFLNNLQFAKTVDTENNSIDKYIKLRSAQSLDEEFMLTTIGEEKTYNPFFRVFDKIFIDTQSLGEEELFIEYRRKRDKW